MFSRILTVAFQGMRTLNIEVQVQISSGLPAFNIVGLADKAVAESRERIRSAFHSIGLTFPAKRITVNLSPADVQKEGSHYDLPIAMGLLSSLGLISHDQLKAYYVLGELSLDGQIQGVSGILPASLEALEKYCGIICPSECLQEAQWSGNQDILGADSLLSLVNHFTGRQVLVPPPTPEMLITGPTKQYGDLKDIRGQDYAKRALEIAAAGGHNLLMLGPPGSGKSMLASRLPSILPPLQPIEALEVTMIHSLAGLLPKEGIVRERPYRSPHHSASLAALIGGGARTKPGEISLAHRGVLFLDEMPEFSRVTLEALRQPLETGSINIARANFHASYPAQIQLIGAMNPCRCGYFGELEKQCKKAPACAQDYQNKLSGPLLDRFDMVVYVQNVSLPKLAETSMDAHAESSETVSNRVTQARQIQQRRGLEFKGALSNGETVKNTLFSRHTFTNATLLSSEVEHHIYLDEPSKAFFLSAAEKLGLSARSFHRTLRVARTIADLEQSENVIQHHLAEALNFRFQMA